MRLFPTSLWSSSSLTFLAPNGYIEWAELPALCTLGTCKTCSVLFYFLFGFPSHNSPSSPPTWVRFLGQKMRRQEAAKWVAMNCYTRRASTRLDSTRLWLPAGVLCDLAYPALPRPGLAWLNKRRRTYKEQAVKWAAAATGNSYENSKNNNSHTHTHTQAPHAHNGNYKITKMWPSPRKVTAADWRRWGESRGALVRGRAVCDAHAPSLSHMLPLCPTLSLSPFVSLALLPVRLKRCQVNLRISSA